jgi:phosphoribosyl 1,2-cyclic phosphate phosphodiesterase
MTVDFLGTGASEGIPAFLCGCPICETARKRRGREVRGNSSVLVTSRSGQSIVIDMPPQFKSAWDGGGHSHMSLLAVLVTHRHEDHTLGLKFLLEALPGNGYQRAHKLAVFMPRDVITSRVRSLDPEGVYPEDGFVGPVVSISPIEAYREFTVGPFRITPLETDHLKRGDGSYLGEAFGYLIEDSDGKRLAYMTDARAMPPERTMRALASGPLDCLVYECTYEEVDPGLGHTSIEGIRAIVGNLNPRAAYATHISHRNLNHRELSKAFRGSPIRVAYDGLAVRV